MEKTNTKSRCKNWQLWGIIIALITLNIFANVNFFGKIETIKTLNSKLALKQLKDADGDSIFQKQMKLELLASQMFNQVACDSLLNHNSRLLFLFDETGCKQCILSILMDLNILAESIGRENIILVGDFDSLNDFNEYLYSVDENFKCVLLRELAKVNIKIEKPTLLILEPKCKAKFVFFSPTERSNMKDIYFNDIIHSYFKYHE